jgi:flagellar motor switch protein FliN/FliY
MPDQSVAQWALREFGEGLAAAVEGLAGTRPGTSTSHAEPPASSSQRWSQALSSLSSGLYLAASEPDVLTIGQYLLRAAGVEESSPEDQISTFQEILGQAVGQLARAITSKLQREVNATSRRELTEVPANLQWGAVTLDLEGQSASVLLGVPAATIQELQAIDQSAPRAAGAAASSSESTATSYSAPPNDSKTFDLLLDVELPVSVSFGHAHLPLKDVLKLTTGSIVELSRAVVEPVDIVVNNCVIAKGEVVVVEGNFGVRIQHVVSRNERLRTLQ